MILNCLVVILVCRLGFFFVLKKIMIIELNEGKNIIESCFLVDILVDYIRIIK